MGTFNHSKIFKRILYNANLDPWGSFITKKKYSYKLTKKVLHRFAFHINMEFVRELREKYYVWFKRFYIPHFLRKRDMRKKEINNAIFFKFLFKYYQTYASRSSFRNPLIHIWGQSQMFRITRKIPSKFYFYNNRFFFSLAKKLPFIPRRRYLQYQQHLVRLFTVYYCFPDTKRFKNCFRRLEGKRKFSARNFGITSVLINQLFWTNVFTTSRFIYVLIKSGGVSVNNKICTNPFYPLKLFDVFCIKPPFLKIVGKLFYRKIKKRRFLLNIPTYLDYDYYTFRFCIWRRPFKDELLKFYSFPFRNPSVDFVNLSKWNSLQLKKHKLSPY